MPNGVPAGAPLLPRASPPNMRGPGARRAPHGGPSPTSRLPLVPNARLGVAFVGSGFITRFHIRSFVGVRDADVVGVWSP